MHLCCGFGVEAGVDMDAQQPRRTRPIGFNQPRAGGCVPTSPVVEGFDEDAVGEQLKTGEGLFFVVFLGVYRSE